MDFAVILYLFLWFLRHTLSLALSDKLFSDYIIIFSYVIRNTHYHLTHIGGFLLIISKILHNTFSPKVLSRLNNEI